MGRTSVSPASVPSARGRARVGDGDRTVPEADADLVGNTLCPGRPVSPEKAAPHGGEYATRSASADHRSRTRTTSSAGGGGGAAVSPRLRRLTRGQACRSSIAAGWRRCCRRRRAARQARTGPSSRPRCAADAARSAGSRRAAPAGRGVDERRQEPARFAGLRLTAMLRTSVASGERRLRPLRSRASRVVGCSPAAGAGWIWTSVAQARRTWVLTLGVVMCIVRQWWKVAPPGSMGTATVGVGGGSSSSRPCTLDRR